MGLNRDPDSRKELALGWCIYGGVILVVAGVFVTLALYLGGAARYVITNGKDPGLWAMRALGPGMILVGILMTAISLAIGLKKAKNPTSGKGIVRNDPTARVQSRFAYRAGNLLTESWQWEGFDDVEFYVKLELSDGRAVEFQCAEQTYENCGEGMYGEAVYDGRWLGSFRPTIGGTPMPRDPFTDR